MNEKMLPKSVSQRLKVKFCGFNYSRMRGIRAGARRLVDLRGKVLIKLYMGKEVEDWHEEVLELIDTINRCRTPGGLCKLHEILLPTTRNVIYNLIAKLHLGRDVAEDMEQEAFIKLTEVMVNGSFDKVRSRRFASFWRRVLGNHLLTKYYSKFTFPLIVEPEVNDENFCDGRDAVDIIRRRMELQISTWEKQEDRDVAYAIIDHRIFATNGQELSHLDLARMFKRSLFFIGRWEAWLRIEVQKYSKRLLGEDDG
jgi:hypothetical protein